MLKKYTFEVFKTIKETLRPFLLAWLLNNPMIFCTALLIPVFISFFSRMVKDFLA